MRVSNGDIWQAREAIGDLVKEKLPVKTSYWLAKLGRKVNEHIRDIEAVRVKLVHEYGTKDEQGNVSIPAGMPEVAKFLAAFGELMDETVEIEGIDRITLPTNTGLTITPAALMALEPFVEVADVP